MTEFEITAIIQTNTGRPQTVSATEDTRHQDKLTTIL